MLLCDLCNVELSEIFPVCVYEYHAVISSTNARVRELFNDSLAQFGGVVKTKSGDIDKKFPCLVVAGEQTAGRGRGNKRWWSVLGCLMMSFGLELGSDYFPIRRELLPEFSPVVGEVVADVLRRYILPADVIEVCCPNDVYVNNKKIAGILIESPIPDFAIIGIGININNSAKNIPIDLECEITTVLDLTGKKTDLYKILLELTAAFFDKINHLTISHKMNNVFHNPPDV
jgi:BirA family biotin operon repressor/biotin-[acetyl-CoA-carboxylase] ligase